LRRRRCYRRGGWTRRFRLLRRLLRALQCAALTRRELAQHAHGDVGVLPGYVRKRRTLDAQQAGARARYRTDGVGLALEQRGIAEELAGAQRGDDVALALHEIDLAGLDDIQIVAGVAFLEHGRTGRYLDKNVFAVAHRHAHPHAAAPRVRRLCRPRRRRRKANSCPFTFSKGRTGYIPRMRGDFSTGRIGLGVAALALAPTIAGAATSVTLPGWVCLHPDAVFVGGFEAGEASVPHAPSPGSGGGTGSISRTVHVAQIDGGSQTYYIHVPTSYTASKAWPLMVVLHGVAPYGDQDAYAATTRDNWSSVADTGQFLVAAPVAHDIVVVDNGNELAVTWLVPPTVTTNDYDVFAAIRNDMQAVYNVDQARIYAWGFSAGGAVAEDLAVNTASASFNASTMAGVGASGANLDMLACSELSNPQCGDVLAALPRRIPFAILIGTSDPNIGGAQVDHSLLLANGWVANQTLFYTQFSGGHVYSVPQLSGIWNDLCPNAVVP